MTFDDRQSYEYCRRQYLVRMLAAAALGFAPMRPARAFWFGSEPEQLAAERSIHSLEGDVLVNGIRADIDTRIGAGDRVETRADSEIIFAVGGDSFILRSNGEMQIDGANLLVKGLRLLSGSLLSVFAPRRPADALGVITSTATIGIRGTGLYLEAEPELSYVCTCYGQIALAASEDADDAELISTTNHDMPRYVSNKAVKGTRIRPAPVINHSNAELKLLEAIVGRKVPRGFGVKSYSK